MNNSAFKKGQYQQFEVRKSQYTGFWKTDLVGAICADPAYCCIAIFCPPCVSYNIRKRVLYNDMTRYTCCNNDCPCSGRMNEQSVASSRWAIQDEQHLQNTACDNCIIATMIIAQYVACLIDIAACLSGSGELRAVADVVDTIAHILWITVCACMQTQAKVQLDERDHNPGVVRPAFNPLQAPPLQAIPAPGQGGVPLHPPSQYVGPGQGGPPSSAPPQYPPHGAYPQGPPPQMYPPQGYPQVPQGYPAGQQMQR